MLYQLSYASTAQTEQNYHEGIQIASNLIQPARGVPVPRKPPPGKRTLHHQPGLLYSHPCQVQRRRAASSSLLQSFFCSYSPEPHITFFFADPPNRPVRRQAPYQASLNCCPRKPPFLLTSISPRCGIRSSPPSYLRLRASRQAIRIMLISFARPASITSAI